MKVGIVCPYDLASFGGVQQIAIELADELRRGGDEVVLVGAGAKASHAPGYDGTTVMAGRPFRVRANDSVVPLTLSPGSWRRVRRALAGADVIHVHEPLVPMLGWGALTIDKPTVATFHADPPRWAAAVYRSAPLLDRKFRRLALTAVSATAAKALPASWGEVTIIPNGIDTASYRLPVGRVERRVCFIGRDEPRKGLDILLRAWKMVRDQQPLAELMVVGAERAEATPGVAYLGRVSSGEKKRVLASSLVYVAPNTGGESFGIVIAEGMAAGCAVICSDLEAFRSVIGDAGVVVPVGDADVLAEAIVSVLGDMAKAEELGRRGLDRVERFDWAEIGAAYRRVYETVVS